MEFLEAMVILVLLSVLLRSLIWGGAQGLALMVFRRRRLPRNL